MSYNHENVVWQSPDGTWNRGFYRDMGCGGGCYDEDEDERDETHEWCREFDYGEFQWVSTGHRTQDEAYRSWNGANPGSSNGAAVDEIEHLDDMAAALCEYAQARLAEHRSAPSRPVTFSGGYPRYGSYNYRGLDDYGYHGPPKQRSLTAVQAERLSNRLGWVSNRLGGYANMLDAEKDQQLLARCKELLKTATPEQRDAYWQKMAEHAADVRAAIVKRDERRRKEARERTRYGFGGYRYDPRAAERARQQEAYDAEVVAWAERVEQAVAEAEAKKTAQAAQAAPKEAAPKKKPSAGPRSEPARRKTTAKSTPGSFASTIRAEADAVDISAPAAGQPAAPSTAPASDDPWAPL